MDSTSYLIGYFIGWLLMALLVAQFGKDRTIGFWGAFIVSLVLSPIIGLIIVAFTRRIVPAQQVHKFKEHYEVAKREEFKGNLAAAIDKYQDALYYLKNEYHGDAPFKESRDLLITSIETKISELQNRGANS